MTTTTSKQRRALKGLGMKMSDDVRLGKEGLSEGFVAQVKQLFARKELVKLRFSQLEGDDRKTLAAEVSAALDAECVSIAGRSMLLYKPNESLPAKQRALKAEAPAAAGAEHDDDDDDDD